MKKLVREYRLQGDSTPDVVNGFDIAVIDLRHLKFCGRKLRPGPLLSAIVLQFLRLDPAEREAFATRALADLERLLDDRPAEQPTPPAEEPPPGRASTTLLPKGRKRKKSG